MIAIDVQGLSKRFGDKTVVDNLTLSVETGAGHQAFGSDGQVTPPSAYVRTGVSYRAGPVTASAAFGALDERGGPLGSSLDPVQGLALPARTRFVSLSGRWASADGLWLSAEGAAGQSTGSGPILSLGEGVVSSSWRLAAGTRCGLLALACAAPAPDLARHRTQHIFRQAHRRAHLAHRALAAIMDHCGA